REHAGQVTVMVAGSSSEYVTARPWYRSKHVSCHLCHAELTTAHAREISDAPREITAAYAGRCT
ncbi:hypothetical protein AB0J84_32325, partial [Micromonospora arborensis]|uniref:hypothetical protein n=1 Tax=Micromonospora arborensis TaxID=2116518 RepID=UPI003440C24B